MFFVTGEATLFYRASCKEQQDNIKAQLDNAIDTLKIRLDFEFSQRYCKSNDLGQRDIDLIIEELMGAEVVDEET